MATVRLPSGNTLEVHDTLYDFVRDEAVAGTAWTADGVFELLAELVEEFGPPNRVFLARRADVQQQIDDYYREKRRNGWAPTEESAARDAEELESFLVEIGYLDAERPVDFEVDTPRLDPEMGQNGPELVTPVTNASMAVGGANARWGSLYDAYFLSDIHSEIDAEEQRPARLRMVVEETNAFLDEHVSAWQGGVSFDAIEAYSVSRRDDGAHELVGRTADGADGRLEHPDKFIGFNLDDEGELAEFFLTDNGLRIQFQLYEGGTVDPVNGQFKDLIVESALTNIIDFEDAVSVVDADDLVEGLRNYLGLIRGSLEGYGSRGNLKQLNSDKTYRDVTGEERTLKATSLMSVRNVSIHMYTDAVTLGGEEVPERIVGVLLTTLIASAHDRGSNGEPREDGEGAMPVRGPNSGRGFVYQVTPKLHTAEEVAEQMRFFEAVERGLGLPAGTMLIGIMNEELGMTLQLPEALRAARNRVFFTNTGFLDRTGSQLRAQMYAGPVDLRDDLTRATFNTSYELDNVDVSLRAGLHRHGKVGKGMQVRNRAMAEMMQRKIDHPRSGGNTAWVPAPYPSDLHSMHYHMVDVDEVQRVMLDAAADPVSRAALLAFPLLSEGKLDASDARERAVLRYAHSMVAYVEPWVRRGVGCSGVPDFDQIEEMKDRATERIDGAILANWRLHGVISQDDIEDAVRKAAAIVDEQSAEVSGYVPLADTREKQDSMLAEPALAAVLEIIDDALSSPSAYVEPALFRNRRGVKAG